MRHHWWLLVAATTVLIACDPNAGANGDTTLAWRVVNSGFTEDLRSLAYCDDEDTLYAVGDGGTLVSLTDDGVRPVEVPFDISVDLLDIDSTPFNTNLYIGGESATLITRENDTWSQTVLDNLGDITTVSVDWSDGAAGLMLGTPRGLYRYENGAATLVSGTIDYRFTAVDGGPDEFLAYGIEVADDDGIEKGRYFFYEYDSTTPAIIDMSLPGSAHAYRITRSLSVGEFYEVAFHDGSATPSTAIPLPNPNAPLYGIDQVFEHDSASDLKHLYVCGSAGQVYYKTYSDTDLKLESPYGLGETVEPGVSVDLFDIYGINSENIWSVGAAGTVIRYSKQ